ncbi:hypothetical protein [Enterobacter roggenkampii]|uniref:hypothetical protein n=1 Tax=Enterobacter roggenkampii TaxID=1812935 RepID=UPI0014332C6D|nr:hypothetical protein [Enterobacter roggenkampii]
MQILRFVIGQFQLSLRQRPIFSAAVRFAARSQKSSSSSEQSCSVIASESSILVTSCRASRILVASWKAFVGSKVVRDPAHGFASREFCCLSSRSDFSPSRIYFISPFSLCEFAFFSRSFFCDFAPYDVTLM